MNHTIRNGIGDTQATQKSNGDTTPVATKPAPDINALVERLYRARRNVSIVERRNRREQDRINITVDDREEQRRESNRVSAQLDAHVRRSCNAEWALIVEVFRANGSCYTRERFLPLAVETDEFLVVVAPDDPDDIEVGVTLTIVARAHVVSQNVSATHPARAELLATVIELQATLDDLERRLGGDEDEEDRAEGRYLAAMERFRTLVREHGLAGVIHGGRLYGDESADCCDGQKRDLDLLASYRMEQVLKLDTPAA